MFECTLPLPPSLNAAYRAIGGRSIKSKEYRDWEGVAGAHLMAFLSRNKIKIPGYRGRLAVSYRYHFRTTASDIGNREKVLSDFLEHMGIFKNDNQIDALFQWRGEIDRERPRVIVKIKETGPEQCKKRPSRKKLK